VDTVHWISVDAERMRVTLAPGVVPSVSTVDPQAVETHSAS